MTLQTQWNSKDVFNGTAYYYARFRPNYSDDVYNYLIDKFKLNKDNSIVLDLGCGTGQIALKIANNVAKVYAIDPQEDMLKEGEVLAGENNIENIDWLVGQDKDINNLLSSKNITLTTMGRSFHWMNREQVCEDLYKLTTTNGGIAIIGDSKMKSGNMEWEDVRNSVIKHYLGENRKAGTSGTYNHPTKLHEDVLKDSSFGNVEIKHINFKRIWTIEQIIGHCYSTSFCSVQLLGDKKALFENDLRKKLLDLNPSGVFEDFGQYEIITSVKH